MPQAHRATIAVLSAYYDDYVKAVVEAVDTVADAADLGLLCVIGGVLEADTEGASEDAVRNGMYRLIEDTAIAGLLAEAGTLGHRLGQDTVATFLGRYRMPCVSLGLDVPDRPSVLIRDEAGMTALMEHLVADPQHHRFAFVRGLANDIYSRQRERIFRAVLSRHGREIDETLFVAGDYDPFVAYDAVGRLLGLHPDVDVIVAANDAMALSAARAVSAAGLFVPHDILVSGFDDMPDAMRLVPALTTVRQPLVKVAELGVQRLLRMIREGDVCQAPRRMYVDSELVVRGSTQRAVVSVAERERFDADSLQRLLEAGMSGLRAPDESRLPALSSALEHTLAHGSTHLVEYLGEVARRIGTADVHWWSNLCHLIEDIGARALRASGAEVHGPLIEASLARVRERIWAAQMEHEFNARRVERSHATTQLKIGSCSDIDEIIAVIDDWASAHRPRRFFVVRYDGHGAEPLPVGRLLYAARDGIAEKVPDESWATRDLLPAAFARELERGTLLMNPVYAGRDHFGYLLIDIIGPDLASIDDLGHSIGNALRSHYLIEALEEQAARLRDANAGLSALAHHDALTALPNRLGLERHLRALCESASRGTRFALCFMDLDGFKRVNDTFGHEAGDALLETVARRLRRVVAGAVGDGGFVARLGGDEFVVVAVSPDIETMLARLVPGLLEAASEPCVDAGQTFRVSTSIGAALFPEDGSEPSGLLKRADMAMYEAKSRGKNGFARFCHERARPLVPPTERDRDAEASSQPAHRGTRRAARR